MTTDNDEARAQHKRFAIDCYNAAWKLITKTDRTEDESDTLLHMAHASRYHWGIAGDAQNWAIGDWQISHIYALLHRPEAALYHAKRCLETCDKHNVRDFARAYAFEALLRAYALAGDWDRAEAYRLEGERAAQEIAEPEDREQFLSDLAAAPKRL